MLAGVPTTIRVDLSDNNSTWTNNVLTFDNTNARSAMTEIIFPHTQRARYIRIVPNGTVGNAAAYGAVSGAPGGGFRHSVSARNASANWNISSIEIYGFKSSAFIEELSAGGRITVGAREYTMANNALEKLIQSGKDGAVDFTFTPSGSGGFKVQLESAYPEFPIEVFRDGVSITNLLGADNVLTLSNITEATAIRIVFDGSETFVFEADKTALVPGETINVKANIPASNTSSGVLIIAAYANGKLVTAQSSDVTKGEACTAQFTIPANATEVKAFLWEADTYIPICKEISIK